MLGSTLFNDPLSEKRFDLHFVDLPYGYKWSKDYGAVTIREPMQNNPRARQRPGRRGDEARATIRDFRTLRFERSIP